MTAAEPSVYVVSVPTLTSARLTLRAFGENDLDAYVSMMSEPEVLRHLIDTTPPSRADAWRQMASIIGHWALRGFGLWAVEERETGALVGRIGLLEPTGWPGFEVAYTLARPFWGLGYAREGVGMALEHARTVLGRSEIISIIRPANSASVRVAESYGARKVDGVEFYGALSDIYRYPPLVEVADNWAGTFGQS